MTVSTTNNRTSAAGNDVSTDFAFPNKFLLNSDLVVLIVNDATGVAVTQVLDTDYTVAGAGDAGGGTVTMATPPATGETLVIYRDSALTQLTDLVNGDPLDVEVGVERSFDRATLQIQRLRDLSDRSLRFNDADTSGADPVLPVPVASTLIGWDAAGTALVNKLPADVDLTAVSAFAATVLDDPDAATMVETLDGNLSSLGAQPADDDELILRDTSATGGVKITVANFIKAVLNSARTFTANLIFQGTSAFQGVVTVVAKSLWLAEGAAVASATDCNIWAADGNLVHITGTTAITDWGTAPQAGAWMFLIFDAATPLTYHATTNDITSAADVVAAAGDFALVYARSASSYKVIFIRGDGTQLSSLAPNTQTFTTAGADTWTKPAGYPTNSRVRIRVWGPGGGGGDSGFGSASGGGGGGGFQEIWKVLSDLGATEAVNVGTGGLGATSNNTDGAAGDSTTFGSHATGYSGGGGDGTASTSALYGGGGNVGGAGSLGVNGAPGLSNLWSGGHGSSVSSGSAVAAESAVFGGGGGAAAGGGGSTPGSSVFGGAGGATGTVGTQPGGGGGGNAGSSGVGANGADGKVEVVVYP